MLDVLIAVILGIVEGITEWLPISSTGHMILVEQFLHMSTSHEFNSMFRVVIQLGAIMAVVVLYFNKLNPFSKRKSAKQKRNTYTCDRPGGNSTGCNRASGDRDPGSAPEFSGDAVRTDIERRKDPGFTGRQSTLCQYALL